MDGGDPAGGSRELARLIDEAGEQVVWDLKHYLGVDLLDIFRDGSGLSPRLVLVYIRGLPAESATVAYLRGGDEFRGWGPEMYMYANLIDAIRQDTHTFVAANSKRRPAAPEPFPRPEKKAKKNTTGFAAMARASIASMRKNKKG